MPGGDPQTILAAYGVSRETADGLTVLAEELHRWQRIKNLVGPATLSEVWTRHIADSLQLLQLALTSRTWLDLGSGAGFPGLVIGIALRERQGGRIDLVESNSRKCAFLRHVARLTAAPVTVHDARLEDVVAGFAGRVDVVTARALAPLPQLIAWTEPLLTSGTLGLFPKGQEVDAELTEARKSWRVTEDSVASRTDGRGRILRITAVEAIGTR